MAFWCGPDPDPQISDIFVIDLEDANKNVRTKIQFFNKVFLHITF
jgi:hypothetical protein